MGYVTRPNMIDVSNSNTPAVDRSDQPGAGQLLPAVATLAATASSASPRPMRTAATTAVPRSSTTATAPMSIYTAGQRRQRQQPAAQRRHPRRRARRSSRPRSKPESAQNPGQPTPVGSFSVTQLGPGRQGRQGHQLPRADRVRQRRLLHQGQRQQRRQHRVLRRHHRQGVPERRRPAGARRDAAYLADRLRPGAAADKGVFPYNMCVLKGFPTALKIATDVVPVRAVVRQLTHAVRGGRG